MKKQYIMILATFLLQFQAHATLGPLPEETRWYTNHQNEEFNADDEQENTILSNYYDSGRILTLQGVRELCIYLRRIDPPAHYALLNKHLSPEVRQANSITPNLFQSTSPISSLLFSLLDKILSYYKQTDITTTTVPTPIDYALSPHTETTYTDPCSLRFALSYIERGLNFIGVYITNNTDYPAETGHEQIINSIFTLLQQLELHLLLNPIAGA